MWIFKRDKLLASGATNMNFLFNEGKFYIMDNHLAASWCWMKKINTDLQPIGLFHIDRHFDFLCNKLEEEILDNRSYLQGSFNEYIKVKDRNGYPFVRFDNYIDIYHKLYPGKINTHYFATHKDGTRPIEKLTYEPKIQELPDNILYWIEERKIKWVINIDLDYFFCDRNQKCYKFLSNEYITHICEEIKLSMDNIIVITICLSPEFCGGWRNSFQVLKLITDYFDINFNNDWEIPN